MTAAGDYLAGLPFTPDRFQTEAVAALDGGESVVVTAPTGAGKTVVAEAAIRAARASGRRAFYTTPIKALSNQKFNELRAEYGRAEVGLLTGDNSINGRAPVVVMTTEVLRNMIYADSPDLEDVAVAILDEVHYLQDPFRGAVWEEVIIHLDRSIRLVCLSATISNPGEFTEWVAGRRGPTRLIVEDTRPVPLESWYLVRDSYQENGLVFEPVFAGGQANPSLVKLLRPSRNRRRRFITPRRSEVVRLLDDFERLPAIYFVFSRKGCEAAADRVAGELRLTSTGEAREIAAFAEERTSHLSDDDRTALDYRYWLRRLETGIAAHHAGVVPAFKETVEELFGRGLIKVVFATETLALGINMPARTVVLESLSKYTGEGHELLQPGDFTQLTGRAGRRGIDARGTAVVLHSAFVPFQKVAAIAAAGSHPLESSFRPTYNMAVNLVANYPQERAEELLEASFGQFRTQRARDRLEAQIRDAEAQLEDGRERAACERGDIWAFAATGPGSRPHHSVMRAFARELGAGDVVELTRDGKAERHVVLARGTGSNPRLLLLSDRGRLQRVRPDELPPQTVRVGTMSLPEPFRPRQPGYQREAASDLRAWDPGTESPVAAYGPPGASHPVAACPRLAEHLQWVERARRAESELRRLRRRNRRLGGGLVRALGNVLALLGRWGYVSGWSLSAKGERLRFIYGDLDLRVVESVSEGLFDGLAPAETAALASAFVYEPRAEEVLGEWPTALLADRAKALDDLDHRLAADEEEFGVAPARAPHAGFADTIYAWATGIELEELLGDGMAAGDLVRNCRQVLDLLRQLTDAFPELSARTRAAAALVDRGVVAAGGVE